MAPTTFGTPVQTPVTGDEFHGNQQEPLQALAQFYRALNARDLEMMRQNWTTSADAAMDNPLGGIKRGWDEIGTVYEKLFRSKGRYYFEFFDYTLHESGEFFYVVGRERGELDRDGRPMQLAIRTSRIFKRGSDGKWRQVHHHGSIDNPEMLGAYQERVLGSR